VGPRLWPAFYSELFGDDFYWRSPGPCSPEDRIVNGDDRFDAHRCRARGHRADRHLLTPTTSPAHDVEAHDALSACSTGKLRERRSNACAIRAE